MNNSSAGGRSLKVYFTVLLVAMAGSGCRTVRYVGGDGNLLIQISLKDTREAVQEFAIEQALWENDWVDEHLEPGEREAIGFGSVHVTQYHAMLYRATEFALRIPAYDYGEERRAYGSDEVLAIRGRFTMVDIYYPGHEIILWGGWGGPDRGEGGRGGPWTWKAELVPWDNSSKVFKWLWDSDLGSSVLFDRRLDAWKRAARSEEMRPAIRRIYEWYIARYEAAIRQDPSLASEETQRKRIEILRQRLSQMSASSAP